MCIFRGQNNVVIAHTRGPTWGSAPPWESTGTRQGPSFKPQPQKHLGSYRSREPWFLSGSGCGVKLVPNHTQCPEPRSPSHQASTSPLQCMTPGKSRGPTDSTQPAHPSFLREEVEAQRRQRACPGVREQGSGGQAWDQVYSGLPRPLHSRLSPSFPSLAETLRAVSSNRGPGKRRTRPRPPSKSPDAKLKALPGSRATGVYRFPHHTPWTPR